jgi:hypothetical protein
MKYGEKKMEQGLPDQIIEKYQGNLKLIEGRMEEFVDQSKVPPDLVRSRINTQMVIEKRTTTFNSNDKLELLDRLEAWYADQGFEFPNPEYLERQRARYREKAE